MSLERSRSIAMYKNILSPMVTTTMIFGSGVSRFSEIPFVGYAEKLLSLLLFCGLTFIAIQAVFARTGIDKWIQFSLYVVPLLSMICGHLIFKSRSFRETLRWNINEHKGLQTNESESDMTSFSTGSEVQNVSRILKRKALQTCVYPLSLVIYQWSVYLVFFYYVGNSSFSGPRNISDSSFHIDLLLGKTTWLPLYYTFWTIAMYITGFVSCSFILVIQIHKLDVKTFVRKLGQGPIVQDTLRKISKTVTGNANTRNIRHTTGYEQIQRTEMTSHSATLFYRLIPPAAGFLSLGLIDWTPDTYESSPSPRDETTADEETTGYSSRVDDDRMLDNENNNRNNAESRTTQASRQTITPREASKLLTSLLKDLENNSSVFKPFLILLTFFSVTNLVTHVVAMVSYKIDGFTSLHWWTLARTLFWSLLAIRLLWTVATMTRSLSLIIPHARYLQSVGDLSGDKEEWRSFFDLAETFQLGSRSYGFPLTLNQVASIVALVNFSFLIVLSLMSNKT